MGATVVEGLEGLQGLVGVELGPTEWELISQERVNQFADATGDHQWIHVDVERAKAGPFGGPIAHGYLTLALIPLFLPQLLEVGGYSMGVNYGCEKVRFPTPVPVGSRVRATAVIDEVTEVKGGVQMNVAVTIAVEDVAKPACVAVAVLRRYV